jgi:hypothetical protein
MRLAWGSVLAIKASAEGIQDLEIELDDGSLDRAIAYTRLVRKCGPGDRVLLNTTAVDLALGTGGKHFVVARLGQGSGVALDAPAGGHIMKLRYTPMQVDVLAVESQESPHHAVMKLATDLGGMPVVCCGLHSQVPLVAAAIKQVDPQLRVAYCMTDTAALALPLSDVVRASVAERILDATITCGQAFGGQYEAVNLHSGLLAARHVARADVAIAAIGPGVVGTATPFGHGGIAQGESINAAAVVGGVPVAVLRLSFADVRPRHRVVSHHTIAALDRIALARAQVAVPTLPEDYAEQVDDVLDGAGVWERHDRVDSPAGRTPAPNLRGVEVKTMGRGLQDDPAFFAAAFAAGEVAARIAYAR